MWPSVLSSWADIKRQALELYLLELFLGVIFGSPFLGSLHCTALKWTEPNCTALYCTALNCSALLCSNKCGDICVWGRWVHLNLSGSILAKFCQLWNNDQFPPILSLGLFSWAHSLMTSSVFWYYCQTPDLLILPSPAIVQRGCFIVTPMTVLMLLWPLKVLKVSFLGGAWTVSGLSLDCLWTVSGLSWDNFGQFWSPVQFLGQFGSLAKTFFW